jgi:hypothetical protein
MSSFTWTCACGAFAAKMHGPPVFNFNCHCHSCVAPARHIDAKYTASTSALDPNGGVAKTFWF